MPQSFAHSKQTVAFGQLFGAATVVTGVNGHALVVLAPGEVDLVAAVVTAPGCTIEAKSVFQQFLDGLEKNSVPSYLQVVDSIPKTISEKNLDRVLREEFGKDAENVFKLEDYV